MFQPLTGCIDNDVPTINCLPTVFSNVVNGFLLFSGIVALFLIVWAGIRLITSGGDAKQVASARSMLTYAIIGLIVVLSSFAIIFFVAHITNSTCITKLSVNGC